MSDLVPFQGAGFLQTRTEKRVSKELTRLAARQTVAVAQEQARIDLVTDVTESGLVGASHIATVEALLVARTPHAEARLSHIAAAGTAGLANIVLRASQRCR